jgi:ElaB/YqjD/DUF883 family membrane-anchored ribosome-binding protein
MKTTSETTAQSPKELLDDLHALVAEAEKMMANVPSEQNTDAINALRRRFDAAYDRMAELYSGVRKRVVAGAKYTDEAIRENPYQALAITAGLALLAGVLLGRRSK